MRRLELTDGLYYQEKRLFTVSERIMSECYGLLKVIFLKYLSFGGCSAGCKKSNDTMRLIITTFFGIVFGFFIGVSFPTLSLIKVSHLFPLIHVFIFIFLPYLYYPSYWNLWVLLSSLISRPAFRLLMMSCIQKTQKQGSQPKQF